MNRRTFLQSTVGAAAAASVSMRSVAATRQSGPVGANDRIRMAIIGCGGRGNQVLTSFGQLSNNVFVAACDVAKDRLEQTVGELEVKGSKLDTYEDYRRILDRKDIDAVLIATPDHWHPQMVIDACAAGKDSYVEKPVSNAIEPAVKMIDAARKGNRVVQVGLQQRSWPHFQEVAKLIREGLLGKVTHVVLQMGGGGTPTLDPEAPVPPVLNWDLFQGPAKRKPYKVSRQRNWRYYWDYGGGLVTDWGVHLTDIATLALNADTKGPQLTMAVGQYVNVPAPDPDRPPNAFTVSWRYDDFVMSFTNAVMSNPEFPFQGNLFVGPRGSLLVNRTGYQIRPGSAFGGGRGRGGTPGQNAAGGRGAAPAVPQTPPPPPLEAKLFKEPSGEMVGVVDSTTAHARNFLECVKSRQKPVSDIEIGFYSSLPCLLANVALREGRAIGWDQKNMRIKPV
jgi:predicted dehydrogenase